MQILGICFLKDSVYKLFIKNKAELWTNTFYMADVIEIQYLLILRCWLILGEMWNSESQFWWSKNPSPLSVDVTEPISTQNMPINWRWQRSLHFTQFLKSQYVQARFTICFSHCDNLASFVRRYVLKSWNSCQNTIWNLIPKVNSNRSHTCILVVCFSSWG